MCRYLHTRHLDSFPTRRSSDLLEDAKELAFGRLDAFEKALRALVPGLLHGQAVERSAQIVRHREQLFSEADRKSTRLNSSHVSISYAVFCLKKKTDVLPTRDHL